MNYRNNYLQSRDIADRILLNVRNPQSSYSGIGARRGSAKNKLLGLAEDAGAMDFSEDSYFTSASYITQIKDVFGSDKVQELVTEDTFGGTSNEDNPLVIEEIEEPAPLGSTRPVPRIDPGKIVIGEAAAVVNPGYPEDLTQRQIESIIHEEATARGIDPTVAIQIFRHEGAGSYQSQIKRSGSGSAGGLEASYGPYQLFTGGGLGNEYEETTGRTLTEDNTLEGITTQIRFSLDKAAENGWGAWYGRKPAGIGVRQGLQNAQPIYNWES